MDRRCRPSAAAEWTCSMQAVRPMLDWPMPFVQCPLLPHETGMQDLPWPAGPAMAYPVRARTHNTSASLGSPETCPPKACISPLEGTTTVYMKKWCMQAHMRKLSQFSIFWPRSDPTPADIRACICKPLIPVGSRCIRQRPLQGVFDHAAPSLDIETAIPGIQEVVCH